MGSSIFRFKQFSILQDKCAMKVGTDGILLGSWAQCNDARRVLDVGAGTGLLSLMIAQRNHNCHIDAIELDRGAFIQCQDNFSNSPWSNRMTLLHGDFLDTSFPTKYDLIICNPPYFSNSLESPDTSRNLARHDNKLSLKNFIGHSAAQLTQKGIIAMVLPTEALDKLAIILESTGMNINGVLHVHVNENSKSKRVLITLGSDKTSKLENLYIHDKSSGEYSTEFKTLCESFYLNI